MQNLDMFLNNLLYTPGPTPVPEFIRAAMSKPTLHHRTSEFEEIYKKARNNLLDMIQAKEVLMLASSGTGAMEACISSLCKKHLLVVNSGKFGERFSKIANALNLASTQIKNSWDTPTTSKEVLSFLERNKEIDCLALQICESSGGVAHPYEDIAKEVKKAFPNVFIVCDGITALGVEKINMENIDALIGGSQKAFMLPPGLSIIALQQKAVDFIIEHKSGYYFNLASEINNARKNTTAYTPATSLIIGLNAYFDYIKENNLTLDLIYKSSKKLSLASKAALKKLDLKIYPKASANSMSVVEHQKAGEIIKFLKLRYKITLANGQDDLKDKIFRINHMGFIPLHEASFVINAIEMALDDLKIRAFDGAGNKTFFEAIR